jgi:hypothetical protein
MLFGQIDPRMAAFFTGDPRAEIRLDEIQWGGVAVNGIPPLDHPVMIAAADADYLDEDDIVFGVVLNGDARAFPKRILGWHEMAMDVIGGVEVTVIYCTLCGTILPYESEIGGQVRRFGTSGLLYRSNKLFFDRDTLSLWSTLQGRPVVGPLVGEEGLDLVLRSSVTTTWGEWVRRHPDSRVLSLDTGYARDYSEGTAYREYFSNDALMFDVPERDDRLENKAEVLVMQVEDGSGNRVPWAISARFLDENPVYPFSASGTSLLVVTTAGGANRVYEVGDVQFEPSRDPGSVTDRSGQSWQVTEEALIGPDRTRLPRRTANRAFWFGWYAQFPETELIY